MDNERQNNNIAENQTVSQEISIVSPDVSKQKNWIIIGLPVLVVFLLLITSFFVYQKYQLQKQFVQRQSTLLQEDINPSPQVFSKSIVLKIPIIEYESPGNELTKATVVGYEDKIINIEEEFIINPATLGYLPGHSLGDIKLRLVDVRKNSIVIDVIADEIYDGSFYPRDPLEREEIIGTKCITGRPLVTDISLKYCLTLSVNESIFSLFYTIEEQSTMPRPSLLNN